MLNSLFKFLKGYVIIEVYGRHAERFVNICIRRGIGVRAVKRHTDGSVTMRIRKEDFKKLRPIAYKTHTRVHIVSKQGFFDLRRRYKRRYGLIIGTVVCAAFVLIAPRFIWTVEISGNEDIETETISQSLRELGIYRGALKSSLPDAFEIKRQLIHKNPGLIWAWAYIDGTKADVRVYERTFPPMLIDRKEPCDIVAACDGYIESISVLNGEGRIKASNVVQAGEVLISGRVATYKEGYPEEYMYVHARGEIRAYTERTKSGVYSLTYEHRIPTGRSESRVYLDLFGKRINFYRNEECSYESYDEEEEFHDFSGLAIGAKRYNEVYIEHEPMSIEGALQRAREDLEEQIAGELCKNAQLLDEDLQYERISDTEIKVKLKMSFEEDIGVEIPCQIMEETAIDKQKD